jgi:pilus assembly protein Flp/PilA
MNMIARFAKDESGATAIEYGLIAALVAVAIILILQVMSSQLNSTFALVATKLASANAAAAK